MIKFPFKRRRRRSTEIKENALFQEALHNNEIDANRQMVRVLAFSAGLILLLWICYLTDFFLADARLKLYINIITPINLMVLLSPILLSRTKILYHPGFKYFLIGLMVFVVSALNIIIPKHAILTWAVPITLANHYYSQKLGRIVFGVSAVLLLICMYLGMFFGEYDPHLLTAGIIRMGEDGKLTIYEPSSPEERYYFLKDLMNQGMNRYWDIFRYYYFGRLIALTVFFITADALNGRTFALFSNEFATSMEQEKTKSELNIAATIQMSALPAGEFLGEDFSVSASLTPAKEVGGDFYDYTLIDNDHLAVVIGDASGKGVPAAMFMMKTITCFKNATKPNKTPKQIMEEVNSQLVKGNTTAMFVTCFFGILDLKTGEFRFANAGHNPPMIRVNGRYLYLPCKPGFVLGALEPCPIIEDSITLPPSSQIILYTDGVTEAKNLEEENYGEARFLKLCTTQQYFSSEEMISDIKDELRVFANGEEQSDDITILCLDYLSGKIHVDEFRADCTMEASAGALDFIEKNAAHDGLSPSMRSQLAIIVDEIISNVIKYAYPEGEKGRVFMRYAYSSLKNEIKLTFIDAGVAFNPLRQEDPDITESADKRPIGGLGLYMVKQMTNSIEYSRRNNKNFLTIYKSVK
jgi:anti-sigma regulatory factor (Ser/Thr protein kinase)